MDLFELFVYLFMAAYGVIRYYARQQECVISRPYPLFSRKLMKKTFELSHPKIAYPRLIEAAKSDVKKYLKRERNKSLPEQADYWGFDCKFGQTVESAEIIRVGQINEKISSAERQEWPSFYLEILALPAQRIPHDIEEKERPDEDAQNNDDEMKND